MGDGTAPPPRKGNAICLPCLASMPLQAEVSSIPRHCLLSPLWPRGSSSHPDCTASQPQPRPGACLCTCCLPWSRASISQQESHAEPRAVTHSLYKKISPCHSQDLATCQNHLPYAHCHPGLLDVPLLLRRLRVELRVGRASGIKPERPEQ